MKKGIIVLLVMALVSSFAFAGTLKGSASVSLGADFIKEEWALSNGATTQFNFTFDLDTTPAGKDAHETDVWAEISAIGYAVAEIEQLKAVNGGYQAPAVDVYSEVFITAANIHIGELTVGILGLGEVPDYAAHYTINPATGKPTYDTINNKLFETANMFNGITVSYAGYNAGFATNGTWKKGAESHLFAGWAETKSFELAEGVTAQAAAWAIAANDNKLGGAVKAAYASEKISADVAADLMYDNKVFMFEAAANAKYDFVTANVYATTVATAEKVKLDAKVAAAYDFNLSEEIVLKTTGSVEITDALKDGRELTVAATEETTVSGITVKLTETYMALVAKTLNLSAKVSYAAEKFVPYAQVNVNLGLAAGNVTALGLEAGATSTKLVENCTLALVYKNTNFIDGATKGWDGKALVNSVTASATIKF